MFVELQAKAGELWRWKYFLHVNILAAVIGLLLDLALPCMFVILAEVIFLLIFCDDMMSVVFPILAIFLTSTVYFSDYSVLSPYMWYAIVPFAAAMIFQIVYYRRPFVKGEFFYPMLAVSAALLLGGVGTISCADYFAPFSLYYTLGLGIGMTAFYCLFMSRLQNGREYSRTERISDILFAAGVLAVCVLAVFYMHNFRKFLHKGMVLFYKPRNYLCTVLLMAMPQCCRYIKKNNCYLFELAAMYVTMFMSGSRSGLFLGLIMLLICMGCVYITNADSRKLYNIILICIAVITVIIAFKFAPRLYRYLYGYRAKEFDGKLISSNETRVKYILLGLEDFKKHPLFGIGMGNMAHIKVFKAFFTGCVVFYHNCVIQVIGSMGLVGIAAYLWQTVLRFKMAWEMRKSNMLLLIIAYVGMLMMSLVNPGIFCPFPNAASIVLIFAVMETEQKKLRRL